ncbi:MAG: hypothetical protein RLZZ416_570 [Candidatus Parcubacteria bacterium]|jgi:ribosome-binding factor A
MVRRHIQTEESIARLASEFLARSGDARALVTVTHAELSDKRTHVTIFLSVLPHTQEEEALKAAKRVRSDFRSYIQKRSFLRPTPIVDFELDYGEKNRQRVDDLTRKKAV